MTWNGRVSLVALRWTETPIVPVEWLTRQPTLSVSYAYGSMGWPTAVELLRQMRVSIEGIVKPEHIFPLSEIQNVLDMCAARNSPIVKEIIKP